VLFIGWPTGLLVFSKRGSARFDTVAPRTVLVHAYGARPRSEATCREKQTLCRSCGDWC